LTQGGARFTSLALGYYLSGFQPCESAVISVNQRFKLFAAFAFLCGEERFVV
jgi:hypothetical protein